MRDYFWYIWHIIQLPLLNSLLNQVKPVRVIQATLPKPFLYSEVNFTVRKGPIARKIYFSCFLFVFWKTVFSITNIWNHLSYGSLSRLHSWIQILVSFGFLLFRITRVFSSLLFPQTWKEREKNDVFFPPPAAPERKPPTLRFWF